MTAPSCVYRAPEALRLVALASQSRLSAPLGIFQTGEMSTLLHTNGCALTLFLVRTTWQFRCRFGAPLQLPICPADTRCRPTAALFWGSLYLVYDACQLSIPGVPSEFSDHMLTRVACLRAYRCSGGGISRSSYEQLVCFLDIEVKRNLERTRAASPSLPCPC